MTEYCWLPPKGSDALPIQGTPQPDLIVTVDGLTDTVDGWIWSDGAGRVWELEDNMVRRIYRTKGSLCVVCGNPVTMFEVVTGAACLPRIGGDSANGYEPFHGDCLTYWAHL